MKINEKQICPYLGNIPTWPDGSVLSQKISRAVRDGRTQSLGGTLKARRKRTDLLQAEAAKKIGCSTQQLRAWEQGRTWPSAYFLPLIADAYGCSIEDLYLMP